MTGVLFGGALNEATTFNSRLQPTTIQAGSLLTLGFTFGTTNNNGNIQTQTIDDGTDPVKTQTYSYDTVNRLGSASEDSTWSQSYVYDQYGNRGILAGSNDPRMGLGLVLDVTTSSTSIVPFTNNRWSAVGVQYDNGQSGGRGDLTGVQLDPNDSYSATFDAENRNTSVTAISGGTAETVNYNYDGDGRRVLKSVVGGATTTFVYDAQGNLAPSMDRQRTMERNISRPTIWEVRGW